MKPVSVLFCLKRGLETALIRSEGQSLALVLLACTVAAAVFLFWLQGFLAALLLGLAFGVKCANIWALSALMVFIAGGVSVYVSR